MSLNSEINIYVADLAAYNNGKLHGIWIDATEDLRDIREKVQQMLATSPEQDAEEYAIHDHEGFEGYQISEYEGLESAHNAACFINEFPEYGADLLNHFNDDIDEARKFADEQYQGEFEDLAEYAQQLTEETSEVPGHLAYYIDYEKMGRDMEMSGDVFTIENKCGHVFIFWGH